MQNKKSFNYHCPHLTHSLVMIIRRLATVNPFSIAEYAWEDSWLTNLFEIFVAAQPRICS